MKFYVEIKILCTKSVWNLFPYVKNFMVVMVGKFEIISVLTDTWRTDEYAVMTVPSTICAYKIRKVDWTLNHLSK